MASRLWATKSIKDLISHSHETEHGLHRTLTATNLTTLGVGAIIGAGIFVITGQASAMYAGPAIIISFIISGFACMFAGLCYAEFASMIPVAGSAYTYTYATLGEFIAWIIGWDLILEYLFASSTVAVGWGGYVVSFLKDFGIIVPPSIASAPIDHIPGQGWIVHEGAILNFPAMFIVAMLTVLLVIGIKESAKINNIIVIVKVAVVLLFIGFGVWYIVPSNYTPFIPPNNGTFGHYGWSGILRGAGVIFFAYIGFDAVSTAAQEARNPQRDMPIGILGSLAVATVLYMMVGLVLTGIVSYTALNVPDPIAVGVNAAGPGLFWLRPLIKIGAIAGLSSVILVMLLGQPRIFFSMANDGLLPKTFSRIHPKFRTPYITTILTGTVSMIIAGIFPIGILGELVSIGTLLAFLIVCLGILVLRRTRPDLERPFRTPLVPLVPILGAGAAFVQMLALPTDTWLRLIIWMAIGFLIFFFYSRKHSKLTAAGSAR